MNNILYIGPYRQRDMNGIWSKTLAHNIINGTSNNVLLRPIFLEPKSSIKELDPVLTKAERTKLDHIDTVVQHVPLSQAVVIDAVKKNILIPIVGPDLLSKNIAERLNKFDAILVDNKQDAVRLSSGYPFLQKNIHNINYAFSINSSSSAKFDIELFHGSTKLYTLIDFKLNMRSVYDIIVSFIANIRSKNIVLVLFALDISPSEKSQLEGFIEETYKSMGIDYTVSRVMIAPITSDLNNICAAHRSGDVLIDAIDYGSNSINIALANSLGKSVLKIDTSYHFSLTSSSNKISHYGSFKLSSDIVNVSIKNYIENKNLTHSTSLFKTHNINKYI